MFQISKFFETVKATIARKRKSPHEDVDSDPEADEAELSDIERENARVNRISMTDGQRDKTLGINKKIVNMGLLFIVVLIVVAFLYKSSNNAEKQQDTQNRAPTTQEQAANPNLQNGSNPLDYKNPEVAKLMQGEEANARRPASGQNVKRSPDAPNAQNAGANAQAQPQDAPSYNTARPAPVIRSTPPVYSAPYALPSAQLPQMAVRQPAQEAKEKDTDKEPSLVDRFKSAIAFSLGYGDGSKTASAANSGNTETGQASVIPTGTAGAATSNGFAYSAPDSSVLQAGTIIPVMLFTGINTDNAGQVTAQVESDIYDTATGTNLLIPAGSRVIGSYDQGANESGRVSVKFTQIVLPDGGAYSIGDSMIAVDGQGYNGIRGELHNHTAKRVGAGLLNSAITALTTLSVDRVTLGADAFKSLVPQDIKPTITVAPGSEFNIFVTKPIAFAS
ncbi:TrbI/VirB10 family protein [uncultured Mitsuokella sp.]|uniref:TrbI/VirB10 family protein n=1 Tax=uncultured Mitsuokella sp. TaxID=453120 RepID=UPI00260BAE23|nr:TrbI/VirB10 family protein [uncultured Mitsuokella sp.]